MNCIGAPTNCSAAKRRGGRLARLRSARCGRSSQSSAAPLDAAARGARAPSRGSAFSQAISSARSSDAFDAAGVDRAQRQRLELEELAELAAPSAAAGTLSTRFSIRTPHWPGPVQARLDAGDHAGLHRHRGIGDGPRDRLRTFVDVEEVADAVAGAVAVVEAVLPERRARDRVEHRRQRAAREARAAQRHRALAAPACSRAAAPR